LSEKAIVYARQDEQLQIPTTVRVEWFPNGDIEPRMYWLPDESCRQVKHVYECIPLTVLKERVAGLRFRVKAEAIETSEPLCVNESMQSETYLYLEDKRFCEKNIIDERYGHESKEYITVVLDVFPNGEYEIVYFWVSGMRYVVEKILEVEPRASYYAGGAGVRHKVEARQVNADDDEDADESRISRREAYLYFEINKWFVRKANERNLVI